MCKEFTVDIIAKSSLLCLKYLLCNSVLCRQMKSWLRILPVDIEQRLQASFWVFRSATEKSLSPRFQKLRELAACLSFSYQVLTFKSSRLFVIVAVKSRALLAWPFLHRNVNVS